MQYNQKVIDRVTDPKNSGVMNIDDPEVGVGLVGSPACGDVLQLFLRIRKNKIIEAKFQAFGCGSAIASSQFVTEKLKGALIDEAKKISNQVIFDYLKLPPVKLHCSVLAAEAIDAALEDYKTKNKL